MLGKLVNRAFVLCLCAGLAGVLTGCNPKDLYVSVTDRIYIPPPKPSAPKVVEEAKAQPPAPAPMEQPKVEPPPPPPMAPEAKPMEAAPPPAPMEEVRVVEPPMPPPPAAAPAPFVPPPPAPAPAPAEPPPVVAAAPVTVPDLVTVPNVVGMPKDDAQAAITGARLEVGTISFQPHKTVPAGHVISQDPAAGTKVPPGTPVHLVVSTGWPGVSLEDVFFDYDRFAIRADAKPILEANAAALKSDGGKKILIEGHCDERGTVEYNLVLGEKRARAVKHYLEDLGIDSSRIQITSFGKEKPFCTEHKSDCWQKNRRAHFVLQ